MTKLIYRRVAVSLVSLVCIIALVGPSPSQASDNEGFALVSTIATSRIGAVTVMPVINNSEIYLINPDGTDARRLTENTYEDDFGTLSPDGKKIVFDSNRLTAGTMCDGIPRYNISDLFLMEPDGTEQTILTRGASATWSPDGKYIAFHASASFYESGGLESGCPILPFPGAATADSDIFVANVDDLLAGVDQPRNITNDSAKVDDDADWSTDGRIVFTSHDVNEPDPRNAISAEIYVVNVDNTGTPTGVPQQLTFNSEEERGPAWSPDNTKIAFACRKGPLDDRGLPTFEICVMNADGSNLVRLTFNTVQDLTPTWSPDGQQLVFHRPVGGIPQLFVMNADGTGVTQITHLGTDGANQLANWGQLRVKVGG